MPHEYAGLGGFQGMQAAEPVEDRKRGTQGIDIIKGADIGIDVGLRVDGSAEVILRTDPCTHLRQEPPYGCCLVGQAIVQLQFGPLHLVVVLNGILHTPLHRPTLLCLYIYSTPRHDDTKNQLFHFASVFAAKIGLSLYISKHFNTLRSRTSKN